VSHLLWALLALALFLLAAVVFAAGVTLMIIGLAGLAPLRRRSREADKARERGQGGES
jgi:ABC-type bacteriocin/lantibiotic exporter with double-glycine peptidase domain